MNKTIYKLVYWTIAIGWILALIIEAIFEIPYITLLLVDWIINFILTPFQKS